MLSERVGARTYVPYYNHVRDQVAQMRERRRVARKTAVVLNPARAAARKISKHAHKRDRKKQKIQKRKGLTNPKPATSRVEKARKADQEQGRAARKRGAPAAKASNFMPKRRRQA